MLLARHGETEENRKKRFQGQKDYPLNRKGEQQALKMAPAVKAFAPEAVYSSDLLRAQKTALLAAGSLGVPIVHKPLFREYSFGVLEGLTRNQVEDLYPDLGRMLREGSTGGLEIPNAEEPRSFLRRLEAARDFFAEFPQGTCCLLVGHGRFLNAFLTLLISHRKSPPYSFPFSNAALSAVTLQKGRAQLLFHNDTCHLET